MIWTVELSGKALKQLGKINKTERVMIWQFIKETLPSMTTLEQKGNPYRVN